MQRSFSNRTSAPNPISFSPSQNPLLIFPALLLVFPYTQFLSQPRNIVPRLAQFLILNSHALFPNSQSHFPCTAKHSHGPLPNLPRVYNLSPLSHLSNQNLSHKSQQCLS